MPTLHLDCSCDRFGSIAMRALLVSAWIVGQGVYIDEIELGVRY